MDGFPLNFLMLQKPVTEIPHQRVVDAGFTSNQVAKWFDLAKVSLTRFRLAFERTDQQAS